MITFAQGNDDSASFILSSVIYFHGELESYTCITNIYSFHDMNIRCTPNISIIKISSSVGDDHYRWTGYREWNILIRLLPVRRALCQNGSYFCHGNNGTLFLVSDKCTCIRTMVAHVSRVGCFESLTEMHWMISISVYCNEVGFCSPCIALTLDTLLGNHSAFSLKKQTNCR